MQTVDESARAQGGDVEIGACSVEELSYVLEGCFDGEEGVEETRHARVPYEGIEDFAFLGLCRVENEILVDEVVQVLGFACFQNRLNGQGHRRWIDHPMEHGLELFGCFRAPHATECVDDGYEFVVVAVGFEARRETAEGFSVPESAEGFDGRDSHRLGACFEEAGNLDGVAVDLAQAHVTDRLDSECFFIAFQEGEYKGFGVLRVGLGQPLGGP